MTDELFKPSLENEEPIKIETYDIGKLFYVAFFGGIIPTVVLGTINAKGLRISKNITNILATIGILILLAKVVIVGLVVSGSMTLDNRSLRWIFRIVAVALYLVYFRIMKPKFEQHMFLGGEVKPLLKHAIIWMVIGVMVELILLSAGGFIFNVIK